MNQANVLAIKLTNFQYNIEYEPAEGAEVRYVIDFLHRAYYETQNMDILINIKYLAKEYLEPVLQASCLTIFHVLDTKLLPNSKDENNIMAIPEYLVERMTQEAISHARAIISIHTATTPFATTHINIGNILLQHNSKFVDEKLNKGE